VSVSLKIEYLEDPADLDSEIWHLWFRGDEAGALALARQRSGEALARGATAFRIVDFAGREIALERIG